MIRADITRAARTLFVSPHLDDAPRANDPRQPAKRRQRARTQRAVAMPFPAQGQRFAKRTRERASQPSEAVDMRTSGLSPY